MSRSSRTNERAANNLPKALNRTSTINSTSNDFLVESSQSKRTNATTINYLPNRHSATALEETLSNSNNSRTLKGYHFIYFLTAK